MKGHLCLRMTAESDRPVPRRSNGIIRYEIDGLPFGQQGWIADVGDHWELSRRIGGKQFGGTEDYGTAEQALAVVQKCFSD